MSKFKVGDKVQLDVSPYIVGRIFKIDFDGECRCITSDGQKFYAYSSDLSHVSDTAQITYEMLGSAEKTEKFTWQQLDATTYRAKVPGGWLVRFERFAGDAMTFVPDKDHSWNVEGV